MQDLVTLHGIDLIKCLILSFHWPVLCSAMTYVLFWQTAREKHHGVLRRDNLGQFFQQLGMRIISLQYVRRSSKVPPLLLRGEPFTSRLSWECYERKKALRERSECNLQLRFFFLPSLSIFIPPRIKIQEDFHLIPNIIS